MPENIALIATATVQSNVSSTVQFNSIPTTYPILYLVGHAKIKGTTANTRVDITANGVAVSSNSYGGFITAPASTETWITANTQSLLVYPSLNPDNYNATFRAWCVGADDTSTQKTFLTQSGTYAARQFIGSITINTTSAISSLTLSTSDSSNWDGTLKIFLYGLTT